ncbi:MAG: T9SS type A sorting domain-containing protein [Flavobacteriaceae bacterium]
MKKKCILIIAFITLSLWGGLGYSQEYLQMIDAGTYSVEEIVNNAETYFADKDKGRGSGYKQFKRWEYMAKRLMNENGYLTPFTERLAELERYNSYLNETEGQRQSLFDDWQELGPDYWNATTHWSPGVGRITGIAIDATNTNHIIVGGETGGVWRTVDAGATWAPLGDYFSNLYVYSVAIDPNDSDTYYFGSTNGIIYKSTDAGATWNLLGNAGVSIVNKILLHPTDPNILFATSQNSGIYGSTNGGANWTKLINSEPRGYDIEFRPGDSNTVYASGNGFYLSSDGGVNFTQITGFDSGPKMIGVTAANPDIVYVVEAASGQFNGFYQSTNSGVSFTELNHAGRNYFGYDTAGFDPGGQAPRDMDIAVNPNDENEVHIAGVLTWRSLDGGTNFTCTADWIPDAAAGANIGYCHADVDILEFMGTTLYVGTDGGIFKAVDTGNLNANYYEDLTTGIGIRQFYKIGVSQTPQVRVTGGSQDNGSSFYDAGTGQWIDWVGADGMEGFVSKDNNDTMFAMIQFGSMYRTTTGGNNLTGLNNPGSGSGNWVSPFEQDPLDTGVIYCGYNRVYKNVNNGNGSWTAISQDFVGNLDNLKIAPSNHQVMYASRSALIYRTLDGGATDWVQMTQPGGFINAIAIHPSNPDKIAVAVSGSTKVRVSDDGGATWQDYLFNLPNFSSLAVVWDDNGNDGLYVGMDYGIYYIDNTFSEWQPFTTNLPNVIINELEINQADGKIYAGTYGRGLWVSPKYGIVLATNNVLTPDVVTLYPNPASETLKILYQGQVEMDVRIFDASGKLVVFEKDILFNNQHSINTSQLNSGLYFVRLNSGKGVVTKRFIKN